MVIDSKDWKDRDLAPQRKFRSQEGVYGREGVGWVSLSSPSHSCGGERDGRTEGST